MESVFKEDLFYYTDNSTVRYKFVLHANNYGLQKMSKRLVGGGGGGSKN